MEQVGTRYTNETRARPMVEDIRIVIARHGPVSKLHGLTQKGLDWIKENMVGESPVTITTDTAEELQELIEKAGLTVLLK